MLHSAETLEQMNENTENSSQNVVDLKPPKKVLKFNLQHEVCFNINRNQSRTVQRLRS